MNMHNKILVRMVLHDSTNKTPRINTTTTLTKFNTLIVEVNFLLKKKSKFILDNIT